MSKQKLLIQVCLLLFAIRFGDMILEDILNKPPSWHWLADFCGVVALSFCWWGLLRWPGHHHLVKAFHPNP